MIVSYNWLKELLNLNVPYEKLVEELSLYSVEVETSKKMVNATNLVIGHVLEVKNHENSDHLHVCKVDLGGRIDQIVCGAPNIKEGQHVIVALPGAKLPGGEIKKGVIRGVESNGMICSLQELGIENKYVPAIYQDGIYVLGSDAAPGKSALEYLCFDDYQIELSLTPNRMDLMSMLGVAHDVKAMYNLDINYPASTFKETNKNTSDEIDVELQTDKCLSYYARVVKDVVIKESPNFIKARLIASGVRPINNVVDITNYVLMLFGQPLHSFDQDKLGNKIIVRNAHKDETIVTLDDIERKLEDSDIVISDNLESNRAVCVAGVMGGKSTEVDENTKNIVLESAVFAPLSIRKTSSRLGLRSESSVRYERGVDLNGSLDAVNYACYLLEKYADGKVSKGYVHEGTSHVEDKVINISEEYVTKYLGININKEKICDICSKLDFKVESSNKEIKVSVPNRRLDVNISRDLLEEVARIYGYDKLNETLPQVEVTGSLTKNQRIDRTIRKTMKGLGMNECLTYSLISPKLDGKFDYLYNKDECLPITLLHPMTEEHSIMRRSLVASLLEVVCYNNARKINNEMVYELGKRYYLKGEESVEEMMLSGAVQGEDNRLLWRGEKDVIDFYYVKGILEKIFQALGVKVNYEPLTYGTDLHPGRSAKIMLNGCMIGFIGEVHPNLAKELDLTDTYVFEISLNPIYDLEDKINLFTPISKVPSVERDLALVMDSSTQVGDVITAIYKSDKNMIKNVEVFDIYEGDHMESGKKSVAVRITLESNETLTDEVVNQKIKRILGTLNYMYKIELRS